VVAVWSSFGSIHYTAEDAEETFREVAAIVFGEAVS